MALSSYALCISVCLSTVQMVNSTLPKVFCRDVSNRSGKQTAETQIVCFYHEWFACSWPSLTPCNAQTARFFFFFHFIPVLQPKGNWKGKENCKIIFLLKILLQSNVKISLSTFYLRLLFEPECICAAAYPKALHRLTFIIKDSFLA